MSNKNKLQNAAYNEAQATEWHKKWEQKNRGLSNGIHRKTLRFLLDMFWFCIGIMRDKRVPRRIKMLPIGALAYVISPIDVVPEAILGVAGLGDDAAVLGVTVGAVTDALMSHSPGNWKQIMNDHWRSGIPNELTGN